MSSGQDYYRLGQLIIKPNIGEFEKNGESLHLDPILMDMLVHLIKAAPAAITSEELLNTFWKNVVVEESTIHRRISQLRKALGDNARNPIYIATIPKHGYRVIAEISPWNENKKTLDSDLGNPEVGHQSDLIAKRITRVKADGLKRSSDVADEVSIRSDTGRKYNYDIIGMLVFIALLTLWQGQITSQKNAGTIGSPGLNEQSVNNNPSNLKTPSELTRKQHSIAVLPFVNMSDDKDYFADGLGEELLNLLSNISGLKVTGRTSSFAFKGRNEDLRKIGDQLNVTTILEGSVRRSGNRLRITTQLINVEDGFHLWSETYDREMTDVFAIQDEIAAKIVSALHIKLEVPIPLRGLPTTNMEAYQLFLQGKALTAVNKVFEAVEVVEKAVKLDPEFADAHETLAWLNGLIPAWGLGTAEEYIPRVIGHAKAALVIDSERVLAKLLLAVYNNKLPYEELLKLLEAAVAAQPQNSYARMGSMVVLIRLGYFEDALRVIDAAIVQDPLYFNLYYQRALALEGLNRQEESRKTFLFWADKFGFFQNRNLFALAALHSSDTPLARDLVNDYSGKSGEDAEAVFTFLERLMDPATRVDALDDPMRLTYLGENTRLLTLELLQDVQFWPEFEDRATRGDIGDLFSDLMSRKPSWVLNDSRFRAHAESVGAVEHWRHHKLPDFCDGSFESWICELHDDR